MVVIVVALEDWTISVAIAPQKAPRIGVAAAFASTVRNAEPAVAFRPSVMTVMPSRNRPTPPMIEIAVDIRIYPRGGHDEPPHHERLLGLVSARARHTGLLDADPHLIFARIRRRNHRQRTWPQRLRQQ